MNTYRDRKREQRANRKKLAESFGERPKCHNCKKPMPLFQFFDADWAIKNGQRWGYRGDGVFCSLICGYRWALTAHLRTQAQEVEP